MTPQTDSVPWNATHEAQALVEAIVQSWACLDNFPLQKAAQARLAKTLLTHCVNSDHAKRVGNEFSEFCPNPAGLIRAAERLGPKRESSHETMRREFAEEIERAIREGRNADVEFYERCQPQLVAKVRRKMEAA